MDNSESGYVAGTIIFLPPASAREWAPTRPIAVPPLSEYSVSVEIVVGDGEAEGGDNA